MGLNSINSRPNPTDLLRQSAMGNGYAATEAFSSYQSVEAQLSGRNVSVTKGTINLSLSGRNTSDCEMNTIFLAWKEFDVEFYIDVENDDESEVENDDESEVDPFTPHQILSNHGLITANNPDCIMAIRTHNSIRPYGI